MTLSLLVQSRSNTVAGNHFSYDVASGSVRPSGQTPTIILVASGNNNYIATNNTASAITVHTVVLDASTSGSKVLDSGDSNQVVRYASNYAFRATP
ncbi:hypothetical protein [Arthrobacter sp. PsM3]|uniref:hypothetical protein n=1 Tax=Arthrobacter sp. PsM3 TaxID=3030531 RepID=UPI00263ABD64|nr:hypothetical protein [Arthrobacter sp. PsM3]MDN4646197.1 hypothetical protein [Arthrobacter sp. PsM3]